MIRILTLLLLLFHVTHLRGFAQEGFGSEHLLSEQQHSQSYQIVHSQSGLSLIGTQWRGLASMNLHYAKDPFALQLRGRVTYGRQGHYTPDADELYDVLRVIQFLRIKTEHLYVRIGPIQEMRLGIGHTVNHYRSSTSWDARMIGSEIHWNHQRFTMQGFTSDLLLNDLIGGRVAVQLPSEFTLGVNYSNHFPTNLTAWSVDIKHALFRTGKIAFAPYVSYANYTQYGDGLAFGADIQSAWIWDVLKFRFRVGAFYSSRHFIPGYIGALFHVSNSHNRILKRGSDITAVTPDDFSGISLKEARGVNDLLTEFQLQIMDSFWLAYSWRRHFGGQPLSEFYFRLSFRGRRHFRMDLGIDRLGVHTFGDVFRPFSEQSTLLFSTIIPIINNIFLHTDVMYTFEPVGSMPHYRVQRRFESTLGIQIHY
ncbi:MAG: hypothetical protein OXF84_12660 [Bacteroidetes bacterium]|nr:hypothetical protein [Bacteroidota bacterium]